MRAAVFAILGLLPFVTSAIDASAQTAQTARTTQTRQRTLEGLITLPKTTSPKASASVEGVVLAIDTGEPIPNATVALSRVGRWAEMIALLDDAPLPGSIEPLMTDETGRFAFRNLVADSYRVDVTKAGYALLRSDQTAENPDGVAPLDVREGTDIRNVELRLARMGEIHGRVRDFAGEPAVGAPVQALQAITISGERRWKIAAETHSDERGDYRFDKVVPGSYILAAGSAIALTSLFETLNSPNGEYGYTFYPGSSSADSAAKLVVANGERLMADFTLNPERRHRIQGRVVDSIDKSWPVSVTPTLSSVAPTGIARRPSASEAALIRYEPRDGTFEVSDLLSGTYTISMTARHEDLQLSGSITVVVEDRDVEQAGILLELRAFK